MVCPLSVLSAWQTELARWYAPPAHARARAHHRSSGWSYVFDRLISMISRCPSLVVHCFHGSDAHRAAMLTGVLRDRFDVLITTYALLGAN